MTSALALLAGLGVAEELSERIKDKFHQFDLDNSGTLDQEELGQVLQYTRTDPLGIFRDVYISSVFLST